MKNKFIFIITILMMLLIPTISAINIENIPYYDNQKFLSDPPAWATNYFYGVVGPTNQNGQPQDNMGVIIGYCQEGFKGRFAGIIAESNEKDPEYFIAGKIAGPFLVGIIGNISTEKYTGIVGLGFRNETHFYFRLMAIIGPTMYIAGKYLPIS
jgi:hypothetical protein